MLDEPAAAPGTPTPFPPANAAQLVTKGDNLLWRQNRPAEAAGTYAQALQLEPDLVGAHLGMAEANIALGHLAIARDAAAYVQRLTPGTVDGELAQAINLVLDRQYTPALDLLDQITRSDPGRAYAHALKGYVNRALGRDYDGVLAEAKAARLASASDVRALFPRVDPAPAATFAPTPVNEPKRTAVAAGTTSWQPPSPVRRATVRVGFVASQYPVATFTMIGLCMAVYLAQVLTSSNPSDALFNSTSGPLTVNGWLSNPLVAEGQWWRLITPMFLHANILHIATNMLSLFFIGPLVERLYGPWRFLAMYFVTGIIGNLTYYFLLGPNFLEPAVGASGAIAGIFGALLIFVTINRSRMGPAGASIFNQLIFLLFINVAFNIYGASALSIAWQAHLGGLISGVVLGIVLLPSRRR